MAFGVILYMHSLCAQSTDTLYLSRDFDEVEMDSAAYLKVIEWEDETKTACSTRSYYIGTDLLYYTASYINYDSSLHKDVSVFYFKTGQVDRKYFYNKEGQKTAYHQYHPNGTMKRMETWDKGVLASGKLYDETGREIPYEPFEIEAQYPGGVDKLIEFLGDHIKYPKDARKKGIHGKVVVRFVVCENGDLCDFEVKKSVYPSIDSSALYALKKMKKWTPAKQDGKFVKSYYDLPVKFTLEEEKKKKR